MNRTFFTFLKNTSATIVLAVMLVGPFQPLIAHAEQQPSDTGGTLTSQQQSASYDASTAAQQQATAAQQAEAARQQGGTLPTSNCAIAKNGSLLSGGDWAQCITDIVYVFTIGIGSGFAYVSAYFFDWCVALSLNGTAYALNFIAEGWTTARDIGNMAFLFILLYIAFKIMFEAETSETVHMLVVVIIVALLVNFSFFFTRLVIDAGNILSIQFYNAIDVPSVAATAAGSGVQNYAASAVTTGAGYAGASGTFNSGSTAFSNSKDLTAGIMGMLNLQGLLGSDSYNKWRQSSNYGFLSALITLSFLYIAAGIMLWILTVAFITNGVKFLFRIVVLWFLIIASPLAFIAYAVPKFHGYYKQWQDALIQHAFYPVVFMFIFLILTNFAKQMGQNNALLNGIFNGLANTNGSTSAISSIGYAVANVGIRMGFVIAMLYIGMEAAKKFGVMGSDAANHAGNWVGAKMTGTYGRVGGFAGRNTLGWAGDKYAKSNLGRDLAARGGFLGRTVWRGAGVLGKQSFDVRGGLAAVGVKEALVGKAGGQGGYNAAFDARIKKREEEAAKLKPSEKNLALAQEKAIRELDDSEKQRLFDAADKYAKAKADRTAGDATSADVKAAKDAYNAVVEDVGLKDILKKAKANAGGDNVTNYANSLDKKGIRNLWGAAQGSPGWIRGSDREAAIKLRGAGSDAERIKNILARKGFKAATPPAAPTTATATPPGAAPGSTGAPGMAPMTRANMEMASKTGEKLAEGIMKAVDRKFGSTPAWRSQGPSGQTNNSSSTANVARETMRLQRNAVKQKIEDTKRGPGGAGTLRTVSRSVTRPERPAPNTAPTQNNNTQPNTGQKGSSNLKI